jgi:hypothetical protein
VFGRVHLWPLQALYQGLSSRPVQAGSAESVPVAYTIAYILKSARLPASRVRRGRSRPVRVVDRCGSRCPSSPVTHCSERGARYPGSVAAQPVMTAEEWFEGMRRARPPTPDDVTILWDGRRLDSREAVMEWLAEVEVKRAEEAATAANAES